LERTEAEAQARLGELEEALSNAERELLIRYAHDLAALWKAPATRPQDRKRIARCLLEAVVVTVPPEEGAMVKGEVHWKGGEVSVGEVPKGRTGIHRYVSDPEVVELVRTLSEEFSDKQIARILRRKRLRTPKGLPFAPYHVANVRHRYNIAKGPRVPLGGKDIYTAQQAAELLEIDRCTVIRWVEVGLLQGAQVTDGAPWRIRVTEEDIKRVKASDVGKDWMG
jgi:hypothetical protein